MSIKSTILNWWRGGYKPTEEVYPSPLSPEQLRMISLSAPLQFDSKDRCNTRLCPLAIASDVAAIYDLQVKRWATNKEQALDALAKMSEESAKVVAASDAQYPPIAWYAGNLVDIARFCFAAKYISEEEAWRYIEQAWDWVKDRYSSWQEYGEAFLKGHQAWWQSSTIVDDRARDLFIADVQKALPILLDPNNSKSPWQQVAWK